MQEKSKEYNEKEQQVAENRSRNTLFERRENLQKHESYASERRQYDAIRNGQPDRIQSVFQIMFHKKYLRVVFSYYKL